MSAEPTKVGEGHSEYGIPPLAEARLDPRFQIETMGIATRKGVREVPVEFSMSIAEVEGAEYVYMREDNGVRSRLPLREFEGLLEHAKMVYKKSRLRIALALREGAEEAELGGDEERVVERGE